MVCAEREERAPKASCPSGASPQTHVSYEVLGKSVEVLFNPTKSNQKWFRGRITKYKAKLLEEQRRRMDESIRSMTEQATSRLR